MSPTGITPGDCRLPGPAVATVKLIQVVPRTRKVTVESNFYDQNRGVKTHRLL